MKAKLGWVVAGALLVAAPLQGQARWERSASDDCDRNWGRGDRDRTCAVLTTTLAASSLLDVDGGMNGGVQVVAWDRNDVQVSAKVQTSASSMARAEEIASDVTIRVDNGRIRAEGPELSRRESWSVSYEILVPHDTNLRIETHNGGVSVDGVRGDIDFSALNGGVHLSGVAGDVRGRTTNGGLHIELDGARWDGAGLDVETTNGGVKVYVPRDYSAHLVTGTVNGGIDIDFPVTIRGRIGRRLETDLGSGGSTIRAVTTNGGVQIERR